MADKTKIEWTDATWNPITGCSVVSPGCTNCYAMRLAGTRLKHHPSRIGLTDSSKAGPVWNGQVRWNRNWVNQPLKWRRRRAIFVCAHGDLFHESVPDAWIGEVWAVMEQAHWHRFQVLTKRPGRMRYWLDRKWYSGKVLPNVWLGVSAEDQQRANERIPILLDIPAAIRFASIEPLLGPIHFSPLQCEDFKYGKSRGYGANVYALRGARSYQVPASHWTEDFPKLDWVIVGGESGKGARPMHPEWVRSIMYQCHDAGVPFFFKQWGAWTPNIIARHFIQKNEFIWIWIKADGQVQTPDRITSMEEQSGAWTPMAYVGKKRAGRRLDGRTYDEMPDGG